jgi:hypothetical protein
MKLNKVHGGVKILGQGSSSLAGPSTAGAHIPHPIFSPLPGGDLNRPGPSLAARDPRVYGGQKSEK